MKINIIFLLIGLVLTVTSKIMQLVYKSKIGDIIVIPAAVCFVLAILKFTDLLHRDGGTKEAAQIALWACLAVVCFQVMMMISAGQGKTYGWFLMISRSS